MAGPPLNQTLARNLRTLMAARKISANRLGAKAKVSPRTIANYLAGDAEDAAPAGASGKDRSAKLAEIERLAAALDVPPVALLMNASDVAALADLLSAAVRIDRAQNGGGLLGGDSHRRRKPSPPMPDAA